MSHATAKVEVKKQIKRIADGPTVLWVAGGLQALPYQGGDLSLPDLQRQTTKPSAPAGGGAGACGLHPKDGSLRLVTSELHLNIRYLILSEKRTI